MKHLWIVLLALLFSLPACGSEVPDDDDDTTASDDDDSSDDDDDDSSDDDDDSATPDDDDAVPSLPAGGSGAEAIDPYEVDVQLPDCDGSDPEVRFIESAADWADIDSPDFRVFCAHPGDYGELGEIEIRSSGLPGAPRVLRSFDPTGDGDDLHPVHQDPADRVRLQKLGLRGAEHWIIDGIAVINDDSEDSTENISVFITGGASNNILHRLLVEGGVRGILILKESGSNVLQRSVVREMLLYGADGQLISRDTVCVELSAGGESGLEIRGNHIVSNELYDCSLSFQLHINEAAAGTKSLAGTTFPGTVVANNDLYLTPARRTDCEGNLDPDGACASGEDRLVFKGGGTGSGPDERVHAVRNRVWGARRDDRSTGGSHSWGAGIVSCCFPAAYLLIEANVVHDVARGLGTARATDSTVIDNVVAEVLDEAEPEALQGQCLYPAGSRVEFYRNTIASGLRIGYVVGDDLDFRCNTFIGIPSGASLEEDLEGFESDYNSYFEAPPIGGGSPNDLVFETTEASNNVPFCYERRIITGPETVCIDTVQPTASSPHLEHCDPTLGSRPGVGIDDEPF